MNKENDIREEYNKYRLKVLAKADGKNIHKLNSLLGTILNQGLNYIYWIDKDINKSEKILAQLKNTEKEIYQLTSIRFLTLLYNQNMRVKKET